MLTTYMPVRVYYEDTDAGGVVYHARYLHFCERARTEMLREFGFEQQKLLSKYHLGFVVRHMDIDFLKAAKLDDALVVESSVVQVKRASMFFEQRILRNKELLIKCKVLIASVDLSIFKPVALPEEVKQVLTQ